MSTLSETGPTPQPGGREENGSCSAYPHNGSIGYANRVWRSLKLAVLGSFGHSSSLEQPTRIPSCAILGPACAGS
jgi:hypothetical protein